MCTYMYIDNMYTERHIYTEPICIDYFEYLVSLYKPEYKITYD